MYVHTYVSIFKSFLLKNWIGRGNYPFVFDNTRYAIIRLNLSILYPCRWNIKFCQMFATHLRKNLRPQKL